MEVTKRKQTLALPMPVQCARVEKIYLCIMLVLGEGWSTSSVQGLPPDYIFGGITLKCSEETLI